jgi:4'-phosphopantetheinyl transferase
VADLNVVGEGEVHVWHGIVRQAAGEPAESPAADMAHLPEAERARCLTFSRRTDQRRYAAVHAGTRRILGAYLDTAPRLIMFGKVPCCRCGDTEHGPPRIDWPRTDITFSLSHAGSHWLLAITRGRRIGVDVEVAQNADVALLARTSLSAGELAYLQAQRGARRDDVFYMCWTRKEAVLKACGIGLAVPPASVEVAPMRSPRVRVHFACVAGPREWLVDDLARHHDAPGHPAPGSPARWFGAVAQPWPARAVSRCARRC